MTEAYERSARERATFASEWRRRRLTPQQRVARGKAARAAVPRSSHAGWAPAADRADPVELLTRQDADRVPELVPVRHARMGVSPFTFYRGAAAIMAADLAATPVSGVTVQLCGDAHMSNFGLFGTPERRMIFDVNDFDETYPGPWEWDVKRLAASFEVGGRDRGFRTRDRRAVVMECARAYRRQMRRTSGWARSARGTTMSTPSACSKRCGARSAAADLAKREARWAESDVARARTRDSVRVLARRAAAVDGDLRILGEPPLIVPLEELVAPGTEWEDAERLIKALLASYRRTLTREHHPLEEFRFGHAARTVVGVGSVGTRCYSLLRIGRDHRDPLFLQVKEAGPSVLEEHLHGPRYRNHGARVVIGQRVMQAATDVFLGWQRIRGLDGVHRDYYVRQLHDWKGSADVDRLKVAGATLYARLCGATLARAHARWGDRIAIASYLGKGDTFERAIADFSTAYADQNERDYDAFAAAVRSGRLATA
ncbi:MAG TPA: DUF2252 domain-containing protein [Gaiellales bacterium]|nr:DUF2252 domain-containing protein [Gaiellales bacterium]